MKYLKYFKQSSDYQSFKDSSEYILPNVSYVVTEDIVNYHPLLIIPDIPEGYAEFVTADDMVFSASDGAFYVKL